MRHCVAVGMRLSIIRLSAAVKRFSFNLQISKLMITIVTKYSEVSPSSRDLCCLYEQLIFLRRLASLARSENELLNADGLNSRT